MKMEKLEKKASANSTAIANGILGLGTLKKSVDAFMLSVNKSDKKGVRDDASKLINVCKNVAKELNKGVKEEAKIDVDLNKEISEESVKKFNIAYLTVFGGLPKSGDKKEQKLATSVSNAFPHWCLELAYKLQESNFYKRLNGKNDDKDDGEQFKKTQENRGSFHKLQKKWKNLFSGKARKYETFNKMKNLVVKYSEPWAIAWVNAAKDEDLISESSAIKAINALCKKKDVDFISDLGDKKNFKLAESFNSIFGENFENNSGKIKKSLRGIIERLVSISNKLEKGKYSEEDKKQISAKIENYKKDDVFKEVVKESGILSKVWGKLTDAASAVGGGIKTAGGKVVDGAKAVRSGIAKGAKLVGTGAKLLGTGAKLVGTGALKVATSPKNLISEKWRNKIYYKLKKIFTRKQKAEQVLNKISSKASEQLIEKPGGGSKDNNKFKQIEQNIDMISNSNLSQNEQQAIISGNINNLMNSEKINELIKIKDTKSKKN